MNDRKISLILQKMFDEVVEAILNASGLDFQELAHSKGEQCVMARAVLIDILLSYGMSEAMIVRISGMSQQRVNSLKNSSRTKASTLYWRLLHKEAHEQLKSSRFQTHHSENAE